MADHLTTASFSLRLESLFQAPNLKLIDFLAENIVPLNETLRALTGQDCADCPRLRHTYSDAKTKLFFSMSHALLPDMLQSLTICGTYLAYFVNT